MFKHTHTYPHNRSELLHRQCDLCNPGTRHTHTPTYTRVQTSRYSCPLTPTRGMIPSPLPTELPQSHSAAGQHTHARGAAHTCVCPVVVLHGRGCEEGVVTGGPRALERLFSRVQLHVVVQGPLLGETSITQVACKFPARRREETTSRRPPGPEAQRACSSPDGARARAAPRAWPVMSV